MAEEEEENRIKSSLAGDQTSLQPSVRWLGRTNFSNDTQHGSTQLRITIIFKYLDIFMFS